MVKQATPKEQEERIMQFWKKNKVYEKVKAQRKKARKFYFLDGPPYATGSIHVGTAMNKVIKDCYLRFFRMFGFNVWDQPGYDTHGVPIENKIEKELGFKSKKDIENFGVAKFIQKCREFATKYIGVMGKQFENLGVWMNWNNPYLTLANDYIEGAWFTFKKAFEKGFLYKGNYPVHVCPRCVTKDSLVFTNYSWKSMDKLKNCWKNEKVMALNLKNFDLLPSHINGYLETKDMVLKVETQSGLSIEATLDHPFLTKEGWKELRDLKVGEKVGVIHLPVFIEECNSNKIILTKKEIINTIKNLNRRYGNSKRIDKVINRVLQELDGKNLLPLFEKDEKNEILFRILGYLFGDGSVIIRKKKGRDFPEIVVFFSAKSKEDLKKIKKDLKKLGFKSSNIKSRERKSLINNKEVKGQDNEMYCYSSSFGILLIALGMPCGKKYEIGFDIPRILKKVKSKIIKVEFLRGYFGAELSKPSLRETGKYFKELIFRVEKNRNLEISATKFVKSIYGLLREFDIKTRPITKKYKNVNGKEKVVVTGRISCRISNIVKFLETIGYVYCKEREVLSSHVLSYLKTKIRKKLSREGLPKFNTYVKNNRIKNGLIWEKIEKIEHTGIKEVADVNVGRNHNFIVNGFVTHNCETVVAYNEIEYVKIKDPGIYVKFRTKKSPNTFLVCFTTTPWTLPANTGIMAKPDAEYAFVQVDNEVLILAKQLLEEVMKKVGIKDYKILETKLGRELENLKYEHPFADEFKFQQVLTNAHRVVLSDQFVSLEEGTGLVHTAPGHGEEDYKVGLETGLPAISPVKIDGTFDESCGKYAGMFVKDADKLILQELRAKGLLLHEETIEHDYPICWRCNTPLLQISVPQWFFRVTAIRNKLIEENKKIKWNPSWASQRFQNWLESLGDWPISRQRYWGIPLPIWVCEKCENIKVIGSREELPRIPKDFHRPYIDEIILECKCGGKMKRIPDVLDVWFDSGVASWASLGFPREKKLFKKLWPADFILEGSDQFRGWWNSLMITSMMTFDKAPFKSVLMHGLVLDAHGQKMSKSLQNIVSTEEVIEKYGRDLLRFYYLSNEPWNDSYFSWQTMEEIAKSFVVVRNTFNFVKTYVYSPGKPKGLKQEDKWILSRLNSLVESCTKHFQDHNAHKAANEILDFVLNDFSRWYIKLIRDRTWPLYDGKDKQAAFFTCLTVTETIAKLLAPVCPFLAEQVYQEIVKHLKKGKISVHMEDWPKTDKKMINKNLEEEMKVAKQIVEACSAARQKANLKLRWPIDSVLITTKDKRVLASLKDLKEVLLKMCNAKSIKLAKEEPKGEFSVAEFSLGKIFIPSKLDEKLLDEALLREIVRKIQEMRKKFGFVVAERIVLSLSSDEKTNKLLEKNKKMIEKEVGAKSVVVGKTKGRFSETLEFEDKKINIAFSKA
ncbi:MAG: isoleucine--tRNA ligase [Candidatus Aenigmatarchaeota archaeon]